MHVSAVASCASRILAAVISVLTFHQGKWALLNLAGQMPPPYPTRGVPPFRVPLIIDLCFWGGVWGAVSGLVLPKLSERYPMWVRGLGLGIAAALVGLFIVPLIKGLPVAGGCLTRRTQSMLARAYSVRPSAPPPSAGAKLSPFTFGAYRARLWSKGRPVLYDLVQFLGWPECDLRADL